MIVTSICLSDIPESCRREGKNGKIYATIIVDERRNGEDQYGNTHSVYMSQSAEERKSKKDRVYVGNGKEYRGYTNKQDDDLPA